jgi:ABC-type dipeptide/oligopeptide/nickel transport system permease subunit
VTGENFYATRRESVLSGIAIGLAVLALMPLGDGLRDALDPKLNEEL